MNTNLDVGELILNYDPLEPRLKYFATATEFALATARPPRLPHAIPWPAGGEPVAVPITPAPEDAEPLPKADALVVTWTAAEGRALATLFTPGVQLEQWHAYRHKLADFLPKVTGARAPFNSHSTGERYFHTLALYHMCRIGQARVLCLKSGLHMDYDGPKLPIKDLWLQIIDEVGPRLVITTGTGGGIGADVLLGDIVIGAGVRFFCTHQFKNRPFHDRAFATSELPANAFDSITPAMLQANAEEFAAENPTPVKLVRPGSATHPTPEIVSTDTFAFDDTLNSQHLQGLGQACDMGDAVLGLAIQEVAQPPLWTAIRNASDGQMDGTLSKKEQRARAGNIYMKYGMYTSAGSLLATWAVVRSVIPAATKPPPSGHAAALAAGHGALKAFAEKPLRAPATAADVLLALAAAGGEIASTPVATSAIRDAVMRALHAELPAAAAPDLTCRKLVFTDELGTERQLLLVQASADAPSVFRGTYLFEDDALLAKQAFTEP
jgi:Phosphorylase superfamily